ncbi:hypothetical protein CJU90_2464 [Yarrowia sp. C11]|nr:hypothetical protein CKK34_3912 [Yarrowia sp. E02]KAG5369022.1 hypothetical protein CJU90_2464 [Yarrowia sp. C11]
MVEVNSQAGAWVPITTEDDSFQFFARLTISNGGYILHLADIVGFEFWTEDLPKDRVTIRAEDDDCLIDANDPTQHALLLEKLDQALREGQIEIRKTSRGMRVSVALKMGGGTFEWTFRVSQVTDASELVDLQRAFFSGLITVSHSLLGQVNHLESQLSLKDYHIGAMQKLLADTDPGRSTEYRPRRFTEAAYKTDPVKLLESWKKERPAATEKEAMMSLAKVDPSLWTLREVEKIVEEVETKPDTSFVDDFVDQPQESVSQPPVSDKDTLNESVEPDVKENGEPQKGTSTPDQCETEDEDSAEEGEQKDKTAEISKDDTFVSAHTPQTPEKPKPTQPSALVEPSSSQNDSQGSPKRRIGSLMRNTPSSPIKGEDVEDTVNSETLKRKQLEQTLQKQRSTVKKKRRF